MKRRGQKKFPKYTKPTENKLHVKLLATRTYFTMFGIVAIVELSYVKIVPYNSLMHPYLIIATALANSQKDITTVIL